MITTIVLTHEQVLVLKWTLPYASEVFCKDEAVIELADLINESPSRAEKIYGLVVRQVSDLANAKTPEHTVGWNKKEMLFLRKLIPSALTGQQLIRVADNVGVSPSRVRELIGQVRKIFGIGPKDAHEALFAVLSTAEVK